MYPEAKGVLDVALGDERKSAESMTALVLRAVAEVMMNRPDDALKDLSEPGVGDQHDAPLWRALAYARQGRWGKARDTFKNMAAAMASLPVELQRVALRDDMRSAIEVGDFNAASDDLNDFHTVGIPHEMEPTVAVLMGRLAEGLGRKEDALAAYRTAADSWDRPAAAQGRLRETVLGYQLGDMSRDAVISQLESLTTIWRGDETEVEALKILAHLYTEDGRYRDAFYVMRSAMAARPDSALTRQIQDEAAATFDALFLTNKGDTMPAIDALALFYDFRELTPVGARGDEMIRRLADRLVSVDLLDQAADLLQYQVDHRLEGAARAQVATRLAVIYLMDRKPDRALAVLRASRTGGLSNDLRDQRLLLEARALSDLTRYDLALEVVADVNGRPAERLRADILWAAKRYDEAAEQIELMYGDRYKDFTPLNDDERADIMRAEIGYALASDQLGLGRFRDKYAAKMAATPDAHAFQVVSAPLGASGDEFTAVAHAAASTDTLETFLREMKTTYPDFERGGAGERTAAAAATGAAERVIGAATDAARGAGSARPRPAAAPQRRGTHRDAVIFLPPRDSGEGAFLGSRPAGHEHHHLHNASAVLLPARGEKVGMRGPLRRAQNWGSVFPAPRQRGGNRALARWAGRGPRRNFCHDNDAPSQKPPPPRKRAVPRPRYRGGGCIRPCCRARTPRASDVKQRCRTASLRAKRSNPVQRRGSGLLRHSAPRNDETKEREAERRQTR